MKKLTNFIEKYQVPLVLLTLIFSAYLISVFPPSGDDFNRLHEGFVGIGGGIDRVKRLYTSLNGRVLGNEISYVFIGRIARTIMKTLSVLVYIVMMMRVLNIKRLTGLLIILGSLILMPLPIFRQVLVWSAGFYNYFPPLVLILFLLYIFLYHRNKYSLGQYLAVFIISLASCLFMENLTIYILALPILVAVLFYNRDSRLAYLVSFLGSGLGTLIMFMSPVYREVSSGEDTYRDVATDLVGFVTDNWEMFADYLLVLNIFIMVLYFGAFLIKIRKDYKAKTPSLQILAALVLLGLIPLSLIDPEVLGRPGALVGIGLHVVFYLILVLIAFKEIGIKRPEARMIVFSCLSLALTMGPLLVVSPINARNFFTPMVFNVFIVISLLRVNGLEDKLEGIFNRILALVMVGVFGAYLVVYSVNYHTFLERDRILRQATEEGAEEVDVPAYPFKGFNGGYGTDSMGNYYYRKEQKDMKINIID